MAANKKDYKPVFFQTPKDAIVDVYAIKGEVIYKTTMTHAESLLIKRKRGWFYRFFQKDFSDMKPTQ